LVHLFFEITLVCHPFICKPFLGTPFTLALWKFDLAIGLGFYAVLFPVFVAMAQASHPIRPHPTNVLLPHQISIFHEATWVSHKLLYYFRRLLSRHA